MASGIKNRRKNNAGKILSQRDIRENNQLKNISRRLQKNPNFKSIKTRRKTTYFENLIDQNIDRDDIYDNVYFNLFNRLPKSTNQKRNRERRLDLRRYIRTGIEPTQDLTLNDKSENILNEDFLIKKVYHKLFKEPLPSSTIETDVQTRTILTNTKPEKKQINRNNQDKLLIDYNTENPNFLDIELNAKKASEDSFVTVVDDTFNEFIPKRNVIQPLPINNVDDLNDDLNAAKKQISDLNKALLSASDAQADIVDAYNLQISNLLKQTDTDNSLSPFGPIKEQKFFDLMVKSYDDRALTPWGSTSIDWGDIGYALKSKIITYDESKNLGVDVAYDRYMGRMLGLFKGYNIRPTGYIIARHARWIRDFVVASYNNGSVSEHWKLTIAQYGDMIQEIKKLK